MSKKLGLALGSGGARGVAHAGFILALDEEGIKPYCIAGSSMGAVVGGVYASGVSAEEIHSLVLKIKKSDIMSINPAVFAQQALLRSSKIEKQFAENLATRQIEDFPIKYASVATDVLSGKMHVFDSGDAVTAMLASSAIPAIFKPVKLDDKLLIDGGCVCRVPIKTVKEMGADVVVAIDVLKNSAQPVDEVRGIIGMLLRVYDLMDAQNAASAYERDRDICDLFLQPEMKGMSQYVVKNLDRAFEEGYMLGKSNIGKIKSLLE